MTDEHEQLAQHVQHNCHISDARHAGNYTLCVYLLKMREFYRWEQAHSFSTNLSTEDIGDWLTEREGLWNDLEELDYQHIETGGEHFDPFDSASINEKLLSKGLVYSGGIGFKSKPHFFLGQLLHREKRNGYEILISDKEYARDITSPPAMSQSNNQGNTIYIRRESFKRMIWEKIEEWRWNQPQNAMAHAMACYDFDNNLETSLDKMTDNELESAVLHEIGEIKASKTLTGWGAMMLDIATTPAELMARAVRDHLADALSTLPALLEKNGEASIHFYFANLTNMRKEIHPSLLAAYQQWLESKNISLLQTAVETSRAHWHDITQQMLNLHKQYNNDCNTHIESLISKHYL